MKTLNLKKSGLGFVISLCVCACVCVSVRVCACVCVYVSTRRKRRKRSGDHYFFLFVCLFVCFFTRRRGYSLVEEYARIPNFQDTRFCARISNTRGDHFRQL